MGFIRSILIFIDAVVYSVLEQIFQLIINLANFDLFSGNVLKEFSTRIYLILGLVMVFKLILSFIQILIDPDKINDKETGVYNILKRVVISMILIVLVPSIFSFAKQLQNQVIPLIPKVVLGIPLDVDDSRISYDETTTDPVTKLEDEQGNVMISTGKLMAYYSFLPFFYYSDGCEGLGTLNGTTSEEKSQNVEIYSVQDAVPHVNDKYGGCSSNSNGYDYNYRPIISTAVGVYLVYVLVTVALKIAIRTIKFGICQLIAPIPIASYIDPKSSKKAFDNWVSTSIKVYLDLFTRLIVVYFVIYIFRLLFDGEKFFETLGKYGPFQGLLVALFIIVGLLYFAKEMPKFVSGMLGVPDGFSDIGDMFKGQGWRAIGRTGSAVASVGKTGYNMFKNSLTNSRYNDLKDAGVTGWKRNLMGVASGLNALRKGTFGMTRAMARGASAISSGKDMGSVYHSSDAIINSALARDQKKRAARLNNKEQDDIINDAEAKIEASNSKISAIKSRMGANFESRLNAARVARDTAQAAFDRARNATASERKALEEARTKSTVLNEYARNMREIASLEGQRSSLASRIAAAEAVGDTATASRLRNTYMSLDETVKARQKRNDELKDQYTQYATSFKNNVADARAEATAAQADMTAAAATLKAKSDTLGMNQLANDLAASNRTFTSLNNLDVELKQEEAIIKQAKIDIVDAEASKLHPNTEAISGFAHDFIGDSVPKGSDYTNLASHSKSQKADILQKEAFGKIEENISLIPNINGTGVFTYKAKDGSSITDSFERMVNAKQEIAAGAKEVTVGGRKISAAEFGEYFKAAQKKVGVEYVNAVIRGDIENSTILEARKREREYILSLNIPNDIKNDLVDQIDHDYGTYLLTATDRAEKYQTRGETLSHYEALQNASNDRNNG